MTAMLSRYFLSIMLGSILGWTLGRLRRHLRRCAPAADKTRVRTGTRLDLSHGGLKPWRVRGSGKECQ